MSGNAINSYESINLLNIKTSDLEIRNCLSPFHFVDDNNNNNNNNKEYKARDDWDGKMIHWEMCRKFQFDHTNKWYMHNPAPVLENDSHKLL